MGWDRNSFHSWVGGRALLRYFIVMLWDSQHDDGIGWDGWGGLKMGSRGFSFSLLFAAFLLSFYGWGFGVCVCLRGRERRSICVSSSSSLGICVCVCVCVMGKLLIFIPLWFWLACIYLCFGTDGWACFTNCFIYLPFLS